MQSTYQGHLRWCQCTFYFCLLVRKSRRLFITDKPTMRIFLEEFLCNVTSGSKVKLLYFKLWTGSVVIRKKRRYEISLFSTGSHVISGIRHFRFENINFKQKVTSYGKNRTFGFQSEFPNRKWRHTTKRYHFQFRNFITSTGNWGYDGNTSLPVWRYYLSTGSHVITGIRHFRFEHINFKQEVTSYGKNETFDFQSESLNRKWRYTAKRYHFRFENIICRPEVKYFLCIWRSPQQKLMNYVMHGLSS